MTVKAGEATSEYYGRFKYTLAGSKLTLSRTAGGSAWTQKLDKELSYCAQASDCSSGQCIEVTAQDSFCTVGCNLKKPCPSGTTCGSPMFLTDTDVCFVDHDALPGYAGAAIIHR